MTDTLRTATVESPGATITYDVRGDLADGAPLLLIGSPMTADGFALLAARFPDRPVVTYDPRGTGRSPRTDGADETRTEEHVEDLHRLVGELGGGPVDVFASSGGAVNALAWISTHPGDVRTLVAHEPPIAKFLPDRDVAIATADAIHALYLERGQGPAMAKFIEFTMVDGPIDPAYPERPAPDPAAFGMSTHDDGRRDDPLLGQNMRASARYDLDPAAVRRATTRLVVAAGEQSGQTIAARGAYTVAAALGIEPTTFPSHHAGFLGPEMHGDPDAFAARLRDVLGG